MAFSLKRDVGSKRFSGTDVRKTLNKRRARGGSRKRFGTSRRRRRR